VRWKTSKPKLLSSVVIRRLSLAGALDVGEKTFTKWRENAVRVKVKIDPDYFPLLLCSSLFVCNTDLARSNGDMRFMFYRKLSIITT